MDRHFFLTGMSLGGLTVLLATVRLNRDVSRKFHEHLLGTYALCPVIGSKFKPRSREITCLTVEVVAPLPHKAVLALGKAISPWIGKTPLIGSPKGAPDNLSDNPDIWQAMVDDRK